MDAFYLQNDAIAHVPVAYTDQYGRAAGAPEGGEVTSSDESVVKAELSSDDKIVTLTPMAETGSAVVTFKDGDLLAELMVNVVEPVAKAASLNWQAATLEVKSDEQKEADAKEAEDKKAETEDKGEDEHEQGAERPAGTSPSAPSDPATTDTSGRDTSIAGDGSKNPTAPQAAPATEAGPGDTPHQPTTTENAPVANQATPGVAPTIPQPETRPASPDTNLGGGAGASPASGSVANTAVQPSAAG